MTDEVIEQIPGENVLQAEVVNETPPVVTTETPEIVAEEVPPAPVETEEDQDKRKNPWFLKRISSEAEARRIAETERDNYKAIVERLQAGSDAPATPPASNAPEFQTAVQQEAAKLLFEQDRQTLIAAGRKEFGSGAFNDIASILGAAGAASVDFIQDVMAVDKPNAHKILATLAQDPERAASLAEMDPRRRTAELTRISMAANATTAPPVAPKAPTAPTTKQVSRAPAPPPPVEPSSTKSVPWYSDEASDADFDKGFYSPDRLKKRQRL